METVKENFLEDFRNLLKKYDAEFDVKAEMRGLTLDIVGIEVSIPILYNEDRSEEVIIPLSKWFDHTCI